VLAVIVTITTITWRSIDSVKNYCDMGRTKRTDNDQKDNNIHIKQNTSH